jgi:hypothetical protein
MGGFDKMIKVGQIWKYYCEIDGRPLLALIVKIDKKIDSIYYYLPSDGGLLSGFLASFILSWEQI